METLAKPNQTLEGHSRDTLAVLEAWLEHSTPARTDLCRRFGWREEAVRDFARFAAYFHDVGKATEEWQSYVGRDEASPAARVTHSLVSFAIVTLLLHGTPAVEDKGARLASLAILAHHGQLHDGSFQGGGIVPPAVRVRTPVIEALAFGWRPQTRLLSVEPANVERFSKARGGKFPLAPFIDRMNDWRQWIVDARLDREWTTRAKALYGFLLGGLTIADGLASEAVEKYPKIQRESVVSADFLRTKLRRYSQWAPRNPPFSIGQTPNEMQEEAPRRTDGPLVLQAPCGTGKTKAALAYAAEVARRHGLKGIVYALPTQTTNNNMVNVLAKEEELGDDVGVYHSEVLSFLVDEKPDSSLDVLKKRRYWGMTYQTPVTVTTIDHLILTLCHGFKYADRSLVNLLTSVVVFDELHYYDTHTTRVAKTAMDLLEALGVPFLAMSATLPSALKASLPWPNYSFLPRRLDGKPWTPWILKKNETPVTLRGALNPSFLDETVELIRRTAAPRTAVVLNRVETCKEASRRLRNVFENANIVTYHSEYTRADRREKERLIRALFRSPNRREGDDRRILAKHMLRDDAPGILVSTQVAEISLDISVHLMISELAPIDALIQRGGRLHRRGVDPVARECTALGDTECGACSLVEPEFAYGLHVHATDFTDEWALLPYEHPSSPSGKLKKTWEVLPEGPFSVDDTPKLLDAVYTSKDFEPLKYGPLWQYFVEDTVFGAKPSQRYGEEEGSATGTLVIRSIPEPQWNVVPSQFEDRLRKEDPLANRSHMVQVRGGKYHRALRAGKVRDHESGVKVIDLPYSFDLGLDFSQLHETRDSKAGEESGWVIL